MVALLFIGIVLFIAAAIMFFINKIDEGTNREVSLRPWALIPFGLGLVLALVSTIRVVDPGQVGIPVVFGDAKAPVGAGIQFVNPFASIKRLSVRTEQYTMAHQTDEGDKKGDDSVEVLGQDGATGFVDATVLYRLDEKAASRVYEELGTNFVDKIIRPTVRTCIRNAFTEKTMVAAATTDRESISTSIASCIKVVLEPRGVILEDFQLRNVTLSDKVQAAIDSKVEAEQRSLQQQFELDKTKQEAEIRRVEAQGLADSQKIIQSTLTSEYLQYEYIQALQNLVNAPNNSTIVLPMDGNLSPQFVLPQK